MAYKNRRNEEYMRSDVKNKNYVGKKKEAAKPKAKAKASKPKAKAKASKPKASVQSVASKAISSTPNSSTGGPARSLSPAQAAIVSPKSGASRSTKGKVRGKAPSYMSSAPEMASPSSSPSSPSMPKNVGRTSGSSPSKMASPSKSGKAASKSGTMPRAATSAIRGPSIARGKSTESKLSSKGTVGRLDAKLTNKMRSSKAFKATKKALTSWGQTSKAKGSKGRK